MTEMTWQLSGLLSPELHRGQELMNSWFQSFLCSTEEGRHEQLQVDRRLVFIGLPWTKEMQVLLSTAGIWQSQLPPLQRGSLSEPLPHCCCPQCGHLSLLVTSTGHAQQQSQGSSVSDSFHPFLMWGSPTSLHFPSF